jgi:hypothetical protein
MKAELISNGTVSLWRLRFRCGLGLEGPPLMPWRPSADPRPLNRYGRPALRFAVVAAEPGLRAYFSAATTASKNAELGITSLPVGLGCALQMTITTRSFGSM